MLLLDNFMILTIQLPEIVQMNLSNKSSLQKDTFSFIILLKRGVLPIIKETSLLKRICNIITIYYYFVNMIDNYLLF
jgi:hypothetical protein